MPPLRGELDATAPDGAKWGWGVCRGNPRPPKRLLHLQTAHRSYKGQHNRLLKGEAQRALSLIHTYTHLYIIYTHLQSALWTNTQGSTPGSLREEPRAQAALSPKLLPAASFSPTSPPRKPQLFLPSLIRSTPLLPQEKQPAAPKIRRRGRSRSRGRQTRPPSALPGASSCARPSQPYAPGGGGSQAPRVLLPADEAGRPRQHRPGAGLTCGRRAEGRGHRSDRGQRSGRRRSLSGSGARDGCWAARWTPSPEARGGPGWPNGGGDGGLGTEEVLSGETKRCSRRPPRTGGAGCCARGPGLAAALLPPKCSGLESPLRANAAGCRRRITDLGPPQPFGFVSRRWFAAGGESRPGLWDWGYAARGRGSLLTPQACWVSEVRKQSQMQRQNGEFNLLLLPLYFLGKK